MPSVSALPFDDIRALFAQMPPASRECVEIAREREAQLAKPIGSLGRLEEIVEWLAAWQGQSQPQIMRPSVVIFAASHASAQGCEPSGAIGARQMLELSAAGGAAINQICAAFDLGLKVFDLAIDIPAADFAREAALDEKSAAATFAFGMEAIAGGADLLCLGDMVPGNHVIAAAICAALYTGKASGWVDAASPSTSREAEIVESALALHRSHLADPLEIMRRLGGREVCAIAGAIMAARMERIPVILDGYAACAAAAILHAIDASALDHCLAGHVSAHPAHAELLRRLGKRPLLDLGIGSGEGVGAALAAGIVKTALACHAGMATRAQAGLEVFVN